MSKQRIIVMPDQDMKPAIMVRSELGEYRWPEEIAFNYYVEIEDGKLLFCEDWLKYTSRTGKSVAKRRNLE